MRQSGASGEREDSEAGTVPPHLGPLTLTSHLSPETGLDRRRFLKVLGVTAAGTAALSGCNTGRIEKLVPYLVQSEDQVPGIPT